MAKKSRKSRSHLKLEALEARQLLAGITGGGTEVNHDLHHPNGNVYDQVLMTGSSVTVTADAGQVTRVSFLDLQGDIVQAEFSGAGQLTISLDQFTGPAEAANYVQPDVKYVQGLASFTITGEDASTNFSVFSVGKGNSYIPSLFDDTHTGGDHFATVQRLTIVADPSNPNGSIMGGIRAADATFTGSSGVVGITAANVQVQDVVRINDIDATGSATPALTFGEHSQFGSVDVAGGDLAQTNGKSINNSGSYDYQINSIANKDSSGADITAKTFTGVSFTGNNPIEAEAKTFDLTSGVDTIVGTAGNDQINGTDSTVTGLDSIDGGAGNDTLTINDVTGANASLSLLTVQNVETLNVNSTKGLHGDSLDTSAWTGLTTETLTLGSGTAAGQTVKAAKTTNVNVVDPADQSLAVIGGGGTLNIQNGAAQIDVGQTAVANAYTSAWVKGGTVVNIKDTSGDSAGTGKTLTSVTLDGNTGTATLTGDALTSVTLKNLSASTTIANATKDHDLSIEVNKVTGGTITDVKAASVTVNSTGDSKDFTLSAAAAKTIALNASAGNLTIADITAAAATKITVSGAKDVTLTAATGLGALTTVDASAATGKVTVTPPLGDSIAYTGGSGSDSISVGATTKAITTGAGDDTVTLTGSALGTGGTVDAGDGSDTLALSSANAVTASADTTLAGKISGFEKLDLGTFATGNAEVKLNNLDGINWVSVSGNSDANNGTADVLTLSGASSGGTLKITGATTTPADGDGYAVVLKDASGSSDSFNVVVSNTAGINAGTVDLSGIETVSLNTDDAAKDASGITHTVTLTDSAAKTIAVSGDAGANLTFTGKAVTSVDASGITKGGLNWTAGALASAATIKGSAGADTIVATAATKSVTIDAGDGANSITVNNANANTITGGKDIDTITTGSGADTIDGGAGDDVISSGKGLDVVTGGAGKDTFQITTPDNGNSYGAITDLAAGDKVQALSLNGTLGWTGGGSKAGKITLASTAAFQDYLDAAAAGNGGTNSIAAWFQYNGDTFIVVDNSTDATFHNGQDVVVKVSGAVDLSSSTIASGIVTVV